MRKTKYDNTVTYKFILYKIKKLICDSRGKPKYINNFDEVIYEVFGVNHFAKKLSQVYDNRDFIAILDKVGVDYLLDIMNNSRLYSIMSDLVAINFRIKQLRKEIRKQGKKNKRDKDTIKEYNYLTNLYKDAIKMLRKKFGIKNSKNVYKRKYKSLKEFAHPDDFDDDDFTSILLREDDFFVDDDDDDDFDFGYTSDYEDDYDSTSELDDFVNELNGRRSRRRAPKQFRSYYQDDFDLDDEDDDDYDIYPRPRKKMYPTQETDELSDRVEILANTVEDLSTSVQSLIMRDEYNTTTRNRRPPINVEEYKRKSDQPSETEILTDFVHKLSEDLVAMRQDQKIIAKALDESLHRQSKIEDFLVDLVSDDEDDNVEVRINQPIINGVEIDKYPDIYEDIAGNTSDGNKDVDSMSREELIDLINQSSESDEPVKTETPENS